VAELYPETLGSKAEPSVEEPKSIELQTGDEAAAGAGSSLPAGPSSVVELESTSSPLSGTMELEAPRAAGSPLPVGPSSAAALESAPDPTSGASVPEATEAAPGPDSSVGDPVASAGVQRGDSSAEGFPLHHGGETASAPVVTARSEDPGQARARADPPPHELPFAERCQMARRGPTLIFDGVCNLCNASMRWYFERLGEDAGVYFMWAQHEDTRALLEDLGIGGDEIMKSWAYIEDQIVYRGSTAWLRACRHLCAPWCWLRRLRYVPVTLREGAYDVVAANRYRTLGKSDACQRPAPAMKRLFLHSPLSSGPSAGGDDSAPSKPMAPGRRSLLIIGCSFSGLHVARALASEYNVTVVEPKDYFEFTPGILRGLCDPEHLKKLQMPLAAALKAIKVAHVRGQVVNLGEHEVLVWVTPESKAGVHDERVDAELKVNSVAGSCEGKAEEAGVGGSDLVPIKFDYAVIAVGSQYAGSGLFKVTGAPGEEDETSLEGRGAGLAKARQGLADLRDRGGTAVLVGAGLVGVELAAELVHYLPGLKVVLADLAPTVLPTLPREAQLYAHKWLEDHGISLRLGRPLTRGNEAVDLGIEGETMVLGCAGVKLRCSFAAPLGCLDSRGAVRVNHAMQVITETPTQEDLAMLGSDRACICGAGRIFALGDCVSVNGLEPPLTKDIYPSEVCTEVVVQNLRSAKHIQCLRTCPGVLRELKPHFSQMTICSLGPNDAVFVRNGSVMATGWAAATMKAQIESTKMSELRNEVWGRLIWGLVPHW